MNGVPEVGGYDALVEQVILYAFNQDRAALVAMRDSMPQAQWSEVLLQSMLETYAPQEASPVDEAVALSARAFGVPLEAVLSDSRVKAVGDARSVAMAALRRTGMTLPEIGEHFEKDHTTVRYSVAKVARDPRLDAIAARITKEIAPDEPEPLVPDKAQMGRHLRLVKVEGASQPTVEDLAQQPPLEKETPLQVGISRTAQMFHLTSEDLIGRDRGQTVSDARAIAMTVGRLIDMSFPAIAREFGDRDHTSVISSVRRVEDCPPLMEYATRIAATLPGVEVEVEPVSYEVQAAEVVPGKARPEHELGTMGHQVGVGFAR